MSAEGNFATHYFGDGCDPPHGIGRWASPDEVKRLRAENAGLQEQDERNLQEMADMSDEIARLTAEVQRLTAENERLTAENERLAADVQRLSAWVGLATDSREALIVESAALRERIAAAIEHEAEADDGRPVWHGATHAAVLRYAAEIARSTP